MATATLKLTPADRGRIMSLAEYLDADYEAGYRYELARGILEVSKIPRKAHALIVCYFYCALAAYRAAHPGIIELFGGAGEFRFVLPTMISGRNPDVAVTLLATPPDPEGDRPASFAIEVVSKGQRARRRDYVTKREEYLAYGLSEFWIADPFDRRITILHRNGDAWTERIITGDGSAESVVLPGFVVPLAELWAASV